MRYFRTTRAADLSDDLIVLGWSKAQMRSLLDRYRSGAARQVRTFDAMTSKAAETSGASTEECGYFRAAIWRLASCWIPLFSTTFTIWLTGTCVSSCFSPEGHWISTESIFCSLPRPNVARSCDWLQ